MNKKEKRKQYEYPWIDIFRIIAACFIVGIHVGPLASINETLDYFIFYCIGRIGVPFFMIVTGYFALSRLRQKSSVGQNLNKIKRTQLKLLMFYIFATLLYLPATVYSMNFPTSIAKLLQQIVFDGTFYHLWYFPAVMIGLIIVITLYRFLPRKVITVICLLLYIIGVFGDSYYRAIESIPFLSKFYSVIFFFSTYTRNGIFFAPIFLWMGLLLAKKKEMVLKKSTFIGLVVGLVSLLIEGGVTRMLHLQRHNSMYFSLLIVMYYLMIILLSNKIDMAKNHKKYRMFREISMWVYILHPMMIIVLRAIGGVLRIKEQLTQNPLLFYILVSFLSFLASLIMVQCKHFLMVRRKGNHEFG